MGGGSGSRRVATMGWMGAEQDFRPLYIEMIFVSDIVAAMFLGFVSGSFYLRMLYAYTGVNVAAGPLWREIMLGCVIVALVMLKPRRRRGRICMTPTHLVQPLIKRYAIVVIVLLSIELLTRSLHDVAGLWLLSWAGLLASWIGLSRLGMSRYRRGLGGWGRLRESVVVIGAPNLAAHLAKQLTAAADVVLIIDNIGILPADNGNGGSIVGLLVRAGAGAVDTVIVAFNPGDPVDVDALLRQLQTIPVQVAFCANLQSLPPGTRALRTLGGITLAVVADRPLQRWDLVFKAILDRGGACALIILAGPLFLAAAIAVACDSPGPVIFRQARSGWGGRQFTVYKFRTMRHVPRAASHHQTARNDPRCTRVGAFLRRTSLDELPQLWNVLCGDMSLVGPRPHADVFHTHETTASAIVDEYAQRHRVKPGMTGWAQIHGLRGSLHDEKRLRQRIEFDLYYIDHWSLWLDIKILARTPYVVLAAENAY
jgi:Undecaprenyl-phosphate glucose phosphotransferase